jgi:carbonic anhydrase
VEINLASAGGIAVPSGEYKLVRFHFHAPNEEKINGKNYPLVAHLVHKSADGKLAVVAVLFNIGAENEALKNVFDNMPAKTGETKSLEGPIDIASLLPADRGYYTYMGSLTIPPCSEGVHWYVMKNPVTLSSQQLAAFKKLYAMNARPVQPLNGRKVEVSE